MTENLQNALSDLISKTLSGIDATTGFLQEEIPEVVQQLLMWHGVYNFLIMILCVVGLINIPIMYNHICKIIQSDDFIWWDKDGDPTALTVKIMFIFLFTLVVGVISLSKFNIVWLQIWIAPKVFLIEYMASLVK